MYNSIPRMSSDFFTGLAGVRFTDSRFNSGGPLPDDLRGGPEGVAGVADGRYNATSELLKNVTPYSMPNHGNLNANKGPQAARRVAAGIPPEPDALAESTFSVFHGVDNGDIAFIVKPVASKKFVWLSAKPYQTQTNKRFDSLVNVNVFMNIVQVNYVLAGISNRLSHRIKETLNNGQPDEKKYAWDNLISSFGSYARDFSDQIVSSCRKLKNVDTRPWDAAFLLNSKFLLQHILQFHIKPFGICAGSEKQGGQHEGRDKPVQAAASYFTTMTVDGQNRDLVNIWRHVDIEGGDHLILHLSPVTRGPKLLYTLNHYHNGTVSKCITSPTTTDCVGRLMAGRQQTAPPQQRRSKDATAHPHQPGARPDPPHPDPAHSCRHHPAKAKVRSPLRNRIMVDGRSRNG
jgi:hypothetical protein